MHELYIIWSTSKIKIILYYILFYREKNISEHCINWLKYCVKIAHLQPRNN